MRTLLRRAAVAVLVTIVAAVPAAAQTGQSKPSFEPRVGQEGKDVVWVPSPQALVAQMLDMAKLTPADFLMDLGSGDGITVIAAAKKGSRAMGIEYNPDMVTLSQRNAEAAGVAGRATFVKADLFETDLSKADVITMFLLPSINMRLRPTLLDLKPGTRIVSNTFDMEDWIPDETRHAGGDCTSWCTALLWIVPAKVEGTWQTAQGDLVLTQRFQEVSGALGGAAIARGRLLGADLTFEVDGKAYRGVVSGNSLTGTGPAGAFTATRR